MKDAPALHGWAQLHWRFLLGVVAAALTSSFVVASSSAYTGEEWVRADALRSIEGALDAVENSLAFSVYAKDDRLLEELTNGLLRHELVLAVELIQADGSHRVRIGALDVPGHPLWFERRLFSPFDAKERLATLVLHADSNRIDALAMQAADRLHWLMFAQAALIALVLYLLSVRTVSRPLLDVSQNLIALKLESGQKLLAPKGHQRDEIGVLVASANSFLQTSAQTLARERNLRMDAQRAEARYRDLFDASSAGLFVLDARCRLVDCNRTAQKILGAKAEEVTTDTPGTFISEVFAQPRQVHKMIRESFALGQTVTADLEVLSRDREARWVQCAISCKAGADGRLLTIDGVIYDVTERKAGEAALRDLAEHDHLTRVKSRAASHRILDSLIADAGSAGLPLSLLYLDIDGFKAVNDTHGHHAGDEVLVMCTRRLVNLVRRGDLIGRLGGDEFVFALSGIGPNDESLAQTAARFMAKVREPVRLSCGTTVEVSCSIGVACSPMHGTDRSSLLQAADTAMYEVKRTGKNSFALAFAAAE